MGDTPLLLLVDAVGTVVVAVLDDVEVDCEEEGIVVVRPKLLGTR